MKYIPNNLRALRIQKGLYQKQVAEYLGIQGTDRISRWENGLAYPSAKNLIDLLDLFGVGHRELYPNHSPDE